MKLALFSPIIVNNKPRAWDRIPTKSNARQGRKVWRRYQLRPKGLLPGNPQEKTHIDYEDGSDGPTGAGREIKRLRHGEHSQREERTEQDVTRRYVATMRDAGAGTPKSKLLPFD